jgi:hypothetical protein
MAVTNLTDPLAIANRHTPAGLGQKVAGETNELLADALSRLNVQDRANEGALKTQGLQNLGTFRNQALSQNLPLSPEEAISGVLSPKNLAETQLRARLARSLTGSEAAKNAIAAGLRILKGEPRVTLEDLATRKFTPGQPLPTVAANRALATIKRSTKTAEEVRGHRFPPEGDKPGLKFGAEQYTSTRGSEDQATQKGTSLADRESTEILLEAKRDRIIAYFQAKNPGVDIGEPYIGKNNNIYMTIGGDPKLITVN